MNLSPVILAIPVFFILMAAELIYEGFTRKRTYRLNDAITNINLGVLDQLSGAFAKVVKIGIYTVVYELFALWTIEESLGSFIALFFLYDLCYYWSHRMAHTISLFWGGHIVHHQSEEYNLSVALRQSSTSFIWSFPFYLPLALVGFSPIQLVFVGGLNLLYQFWIHTEHINRLGPLEWVMNTPSHHRVHHGRNPAYIDKNYAGVFIIWDRLFGTFEDEKERPDYGITKPLNSWNPLYANVSHYIDLFRALPRAQSIKDGLHMLFGPPGWMPKYLGGYQAPHEFASDYSKYDQDVRHGAHGYILFQFLFALVAVAYFLFEFSSLGSIEQAYLAVWVLVSTLLFGLLFESNSSWVIRLEVIRLTALLVVPLLLELSIGIQAAVVLFALFSLGAFWTLSRKRPVLV